MLLLLTMTTATAPLIDSPLSGRCIVVTRPRTQAHRFAKLLEQQGAEVIPFPTIEIVPVDSYARLDTALTCLDTYDWLVFTSVNGVKYFIDRLHARQKDVTDLRGLKIGAIGPETAKAVEALSLQVSAVPEEYRAEALVKVLGKVTGQRILLPRAAEAREILPKELQALGAQVDEIAVYQTVRPQATETHALRILLKAEKIAMVTFTSSSTVRNFAAVFADEELPQLLGKARIGCIGPITADTAREYGMMVAVQSSIYTIPAFAEAIVEYFSNQQSAVSHQQEREGR